MKSQPIESLVEDEDEIDDGENIKMDDESHPIMTKPSPFSAGPFTASQKYTTLCLGIGLGLAVGALLVLAIAFGVTVSTLKAPSSSSEGDSNLCLSESCTSAAATILSGLDRSIDPCHDFYNFTCGAWVQKTVIPTGSGSVSTFSQLAERNIIALKKILDQNRDGGVKAVRKVMDLYQSCLNTTQLEAVGADPLLGLINVTGGWSLLDQANESTWDINNGSFLVEKLLSSSAFFTVGVTVDDKDPSQHIVEVMQSGLSLPSRDFYLNSRLSATALPALRTLLVKVLALLSPQGNTTVFEQAADDLIAFETRLAQIFVSDVALRDIDLTYNKMNLSDLSNLFPEYHWVMNVKVLFKVGANLTITGDEPVLVRTPSYLQNLSQLFSEPQTTLENYAKWQLVKDLLPFLSEEFSNAYKEFTLATSGRGDGERYVTCIKVVQSVLPIALARPYSEHVLPPGTKGNVSEMIEAIKTAFIKRLDQNSWLDGETRQASKEKVKAITKMIAYPDQLFNDTYLNTLYSDYNISDSNLFGNIQQFLRVSTKRNLRYLNEPVDTTEWLSAPTAVNAYYNPPYNQFVFLEGILNVPFFQAGWPDYLKYGALGAVIGHELTHGFDDQGQRYDASGKLRQWWTTASINAFKEKQECFRQQYSQYEILGFKINGNLTLGENIADNGGIKAAFQAYKDMASVKGTNPLSLPSLTSFTDEQLFFIAFGQVWCSQFTPEYIASLTKSNPHSPGPYRVIGALVNSPDFAEAFKCSKDSFMNPTEKCLMW